MNRGIVLPAAVVFCLAARALFAQDRARPPLPSDPEIEVVPVANGVYAVLRSQHPDEQPGHSNSVIIINDDDVVVVDATRMPSQARKIIAVVRALTDKPVRTLVHTHWHDDHVYGNQAFAEAFPGLEIVAHQNAREDMLAISLPRNLPGYKKDYPAYVAQIEERLKQDSPGVGNLSPEAKGRLERIAARIRREIEELPTLHPVVPNVTFDSSLTLYRGSREIRLLHFGPANTRGDTVVYLPKEKVVAAGDMVVSPVPYAHGSYISDWIAANKKLAALDADVLVPGHGRIQRDQNYLTLETELIESLVRQVRGSVERGLSLEETRKALDLGLFKEKMAGGDKQRGSDFDNYFVAPASARAYKEAKGEPLGASPYEDN
jgi:glyoxylase-like metal-dependent hydrolase (beta-lactamase superfamily II)